MKSIFLMFSVMLSLLFATVSHASNNGFSCTYKISQESEENGSEIVLEDRGTVIPKGEISFKPEFEKNPRWKELEQRILDKTVSPEFLKRLKLVEILVTNMFEDNLEG